MGFFNGGAASLPFIHALDGEIAVISTVKNGAEKGFCEVTGVSPVNLVAVASFVKKRRK